MSVSAVDSRIQLQHLEDRWDANAARGMDEPELLRYRSNLLGSDLRITNFGGGNTSSKVEMPDPLTRQNVEVLWVKGSGGDLGSIKRGGFATLYLDKLLALEKLYGGVDREDEMVEYYPLCTYGLNPVAASIDTPLHGFLPFRHVDHLHPDCAIALAAAANGLEKMEEFNQRYGHKLIWVPWQRPGFELGLMLKRAVEQEPACDGIILGGHGLFTWGDTQRDCYLNTITLIDQLTSFIDEHLEQKGDRILGGRKHEPLADRRSIALEILPVLRGRLSENKRLIGSFSDHPDVLEFVNSADAAEARLSRHELPRSLYPHQDPPHVCAVGPEERHRRAAEGNRKADRRLPTGVRRILQEACRAELTGHARCHAGRGSYSGLGMFSFGKSKPESRIVGEFYLNAIHVMKGAGGLESDVAVTRLPQCGSENLAQAFQVYSNYVALPASEAFRIEYWALEEAKIRRQPPEKELSRQIVVVVGGGSGIGREVALLAAERGAHVVVADRDVAGAERVAEELKKTAGQETVVAAPVDIRNRESIASRFGAPWSSSAAPTF